MRKAAVLFAFIIILISSFAVDAVEGTVVTENVSVRSGRLFEVKVAVSGDGVIASGTFELKFDPDAVEYRRVTSDIDSALVRAKHEKGRTTVVFLRGGGVRTEKTPVLFRVTYKLVGSSDTAVEIKAGDCVDQKTKPIEVKNKAVCKVSAVGSGTSSSSQRKSRGAVGGYGAKSKTDKSVGKTKLPEPVDGDSFISKGNKKEIEIKTSSSGNDETVFNSALLIVVVIAAVCIVILVLRNDRKNDERNKEKAE